MRTSKNSIPNNALDVAAPVAMLLTSRDEYLSAYQHAADVTEVIKAAIPTVKLSSGCYRTAIVCDSFVVKFARDGRNEALMEEARYINKMRKHPVYGRHFPETQIIEIGNVVVLIQEKVDMNHKNRKRLYDDVEKLAEHLGIEDFHEGNFGWKGPKGKEWPVFIDVDFRHSKTAQKKIRRRSWMI